MPPVAKKSNSCLHRRRLPQLSWHCWGTNRLTEEFLIWPAKEKKKSRNLIFIQDPDDWRLVQDGGEEGCALTSSCESTEITTIEQSLTGRCWHTHKKDTPHPKSKEKPQWDGRRGAVMIKSRPSLDGRPRHGWTLVSQKVSHCCEGSEPHVRLFSLGI